MLSDERLEEWEKHGLHEVQEMAREVRTLRSAQKRAGEMLDEAVARRDWFEKVANEHFATIAKLRAENERLRGALERLAILYETDCVDDRERHPRPAWLRNALAPQPARGER